MRVCVYAGMHMHACMQQKDEAEALKQVAHLVLRVARSQLGLKLGREGALLVDAGRWPPLCLVVILRVVEEVEHGITRVPPGLRCG